MILAKPSAKALKKEQDEAKPICYSEAVKRPAKESKGFMITTPVIWGEDVPQKFVSVDLPSGRNIEVLVHPILPNGYEMQDHPSTNKLLLSIYDGRKTYTGEEMDNIWHDLEALVSQGLLEDSIFDYLTIPDGDELIPFIADETNLNWVNYFIEQELV